MFRSGTEARMVGAEQVRETPRGEAGEDGEAGEEDGLASTARVSSGDTAG